MQHALATDLNRLIAEAVEILKEILNSKETDCKKILKRYDDLVETDGFFPAIEKQTMLLAKRWRLITREELQHAIQTWPTRQKPQYQVGWNGLQNTTKIPLKHKPSYKKKPYTTQVYLTLDANEEREKILISAASNAQAKIPAKVTPPLNTAHQAWTNDPELNNLNTNLKTIEKELENLQIQHRRKFEKRDNEIKTLQAQIDKSFTLKKPKDSSEAMRVFKEGQARLAEKLEKLKQEKEQALQEILDQ